MSIDTKKSRKVCQRLVIKGTLCLETPTHLGNGDNPNQSQTTLFRDPIDQRAVLAGTTLAGALRDYLRAHEYGHRTEEPEAQEDDTRHLMAENLFGGRKKDPNGDQSPLIIDDAWSQHPSTLRDGVAIDNTTRTATNGQKDNAWSQYSSTLRDGVAINNTTRTADDEKKFEFELLPAGTAFQIRLELALPEETDQQQKLKRALALALDGLAKGEIALGARTSRGLGRCKVHEWKVITYDLTTPDGLLAWLASDEFAEYQTVEVVRGDAWTALGVTKDDLPDDARKTLHLCVDFTLASPMLIGGDGPLSNTDIQPNATHICDNDTPILPGSSLAGALRARAIRIVKTLNVANGNELIEELFGSSIYQNEDQKDQTGQREQKQGSRLRVTETKITDDHSLVQHRVAIDRFTGGALETALFSEAPLTAGAFRLHIQIDDPEHEEIGLLLFLLKDLWTGDLRLGGTQSIGRGRLCGHRAELKLHKDQPHTWTITQTKDGLDITGDQQALERYGQALYSKRDTAQEAAA
ncbi:MAG: RAMP superfamily CRISPR-associated protein [Chloroflexota bacterium]